MMLAGLTKHRREADDKEYNDQEHEPDQEWRDDRNNMERF